ncbi:hypothetical protein ACHHYP_13590 [Achlya hypogyna]|uniref:ZZ-type domain-containing protein n=1 Tax=Achlya hypogyna TaxID=1202772 RepID=A0A1V9YEX3_ACHHY|nr:hypothetical protein ACHHYP_13590 [Achlya hypogyna]
MFGSSSTTPNPFYPPTMSPFAKSTAAARVAGLARDGQAKKWAKDNGLDIMTVSWDDCARNQNSSFGPCISDMTLVVDNTWMPVLRVPNFSDPIMSIATDKIVVTVGNEAQVPFGRSLTKISLQEYLANIQKYTTITSSMYAPARDHQALVSTQACFLPIDEAHGKTDFHVGLHNYQSTPGSPAVLLLVCTDTGTSAQVVSGRDSILYCNQHGYKHTFTAQRLSADRANRGVATTGAMTANEEARNYVMIIQIPLVKRATAFGGQSFSSTSGFCAFGASSAGTTAFSCPMSATDSVAFGAIAAKPDVEAAMVGLGKAQGAFPGLPNASSMARDPQYPIRVTIQFYQATSNGVVSPEIIHGLANKMDEVKTNASWWGSLVTPSTLGTPAGPFAPPPTGASGPLPAPAFSFPPPVNPHEGVFCDVCRQDIKTPERFKCLCCPNFDACASCVNSLAFPHPATHPLLRLTKATATYGPRNYVVQNREACRHNVSCSACQRPVVGILYQCTHCPSVRLCEACELLTGHADFAHPMVKVYGFQ